MWLERIVKVGLGLANPNPNPSPGPNLAAHPARAQAEVQQQVDGALDLLAVELVEEDGRVVHLDARRVPAHNLVRVGVRVRVRVRANLPWDARGSGGQWRAPGVPGCAWPCCLRRSASTYLPGRCMQLFHPSAYPPACPPAYRPILSAHPSVYVCVCRACCFG